MLPQLKLKHGTGRGRCEARNIGIREATGDVVIVLNADVILPPDFIARLVPHYESGADFVLVNAEVANSESLIASYIGAQSIATYGDESVVDWTEGFSCRRETLIACGMFPITPIPLVAGEDGALGRRLRQTAKRAYDGDITVRFVAPSDIRSLWQIYKERAYPL